MTNIITILPTLGDRVQIRDQYKGQPTKFSFEPFGLKVGDTATVVAVGGLPDNGGDYTVSVRWDRDVRDNGVNWGMGWFDVLVSDEVVGRPLVHFDDTLAGRDRSKARAACSEAISRVLSDAHNVLLGRASNGESVDAYALNEAITAAIRSAATRHGQSTARREQAKRFAHVAHIVQAILENHADNLPGYEPGARSRAIEEAKQALREAKVEIDHSVEVNQRLTQDLTAAREQREHMAAEARSLREEIDTARANLAQTIREANEFEAALEYAKHLLGPEGAKRVDDFANGFRKGASDN